MPEDRINSSSSEKTICDALRIALVVTQLRMVWHAGAVSGEEAMELLDQAFSEIRLRTSPSAVPPAASTDQSAGNRAAPSHA